MLFRSRGFTYTHKPPTKSNIEGIRIANANGFTVNISANNLDHADTLKETGLPVCVVLPSESVNERSLQTPAGNKVIVCPATRLEGMTCDKCRLCSISDRPFIIGFPAHGIAQKKASNIAKGGV